MRLSGGRIQQRRLEYFFKPSYNITIPHGYSLCYNLGDIELLEKVEVHDKNWPFLDARGRMTE